MKKALFNPLENNNPSKLIALGALFTLIGCSLAFFFNARFDGVLDLHFSPTTLWQAILDNLINIVSSAVVLFLAGLYFNRKTRVVDVLAISVFSRYPLYILPLFNIKSGMIRSGDALINGVTAGGISDLDSSTVLLLVFFAILTVLMIVWYLSNLYNGFQVATHAKGNRAVFVFVVALIVIEILSKTGIYLIVP